MDIYKDVVTRYLKMGALLARFSTRLPYKEIAGSSQVTDVEKRKS